MQNLKSLDDSHEIFALRHTKDNKVIKNGKCIKEISLDEYYGIKSIYTIEDALNTFPEVVFICNPSSKHIQTAIDFAKIGCHLFVEKPLGSNLNNIQELLKIIDSKKLITVVGYQQRFNPLINRVKGILQENKLISASFEWNTYLPNHHKYENYQKGYAAKSNLGGGVILCLIHEIDLIYHFLGFPKKVCSFGGHLSELIIDVEDTIMAILEYDKSIVSLNLSFAQTKEVRKFKMQFVDKTLFVDLVKNNYYLYNNDGGLIDHVFDKTTRDIMFKEELKHFLDCINNDGTSTVDFNDGSKSLELALIIKESMFELSTQSIV